MEGAIEEGVRGVRGVVCVGRVEREKKKGRRITAPALPKKTNTF